MTEEQQRIAIAESLGWKFKGDPDFDKYTAGWSMPESFAAPPDFDLSYIPKAGQKFYYRDGIRTWVKCLVSIRTVPDYLNDLNACHEFEKTLTDLHNAYLLSLSNICGGPRESVTATAAQRCEAYLRTKGLWQGEGV